MKAGHDSIHLARDATGALLDMPRDLAHSVNSELLDVLTLLRYAKFSTDEMGEGEPADSDSSTCPHSRTIALLSMADDKVSGPYCAPLSGTSSEECRA